MSTSEPHPAPHGGEASSDPSRAVRAVAETARGAPPSGNTGTEETEHEPEQEPEHEGDELDVRVRALCARVRAHLASLGPP